MFSRQVVVILMMIFTCKFELPAQIQMDHHSPKKASMYSALVPGTGQFYNKKYWKIPVIYIGLAASLYSAQQNQKDYETFRTAYQHRTDEDPNTVDPFIGEYSDGNLLTLKNNHRNNRDLAYIICAGIYLLNIIDASVDAHLFKFNVSDDVSMKIEPKILYDERLTSPALSLQLNWN